MFWAQGAIGIFTDIAILIIPIWIIYSGMVLSATAKRVILVFSVGLFVVITGAVRLASTCPYPKSTSHNPNPLFTKKHSKPLMYLKTNNACLK